MFEPENELEASLIKAADDPAYRPQFYKDFIKSDVLIIQEDASNVNEGETVLKADMELQIQNIEIDGKLYVPIFTSVKRIQAVIDYEVGYLALNAFEFLKIINGTGLALNPGSEYGKQFTASEVSNIIDGSIWEPNKKYKVEKETQILIGQPANYPNKLADALKTYFKTKKEVLSAYLAHFHNPDSGEPPHTLIGVLATDNWDEIMASAGMIVNDVEIPDPPVDFIRIDTENGNLDYFHDIAPFYKRKKFGLF